MNLRTLKKLSKRAAPLLPQLGDDRQQFPAERGDNYTGRIIWDRKHWERSNCHPTYEPISEGEIVYATRAGRRVVMRWPCHPRKGTVMVGAVSGYYEPEWDEETAWEALSKLVRMEFTDWTPELADEMEPAVLLRPLDTPSAIFRAAADLLASRTKEAGNG